MTHRFSPPVPASEARLPKSILDLVLAVGAFFSALIFMEPSSVGALGALHGGPEGRLHIGIGNTAHQPKLMDDLTEPLMELAPAPEEKTIVRRNPDLPHLARRKTEIMKAHL